MTNFLADVRRLAERYRPDIVRFLRDMIAIPSESCGEEGVIRRIVAEMEKVGFDEVRINAMGNVIGRIGSGPHVIAMDAHIDTVGIGERRNWTFDPYAGKEDDACVYGRGASDQEGGMASMVHAGRIMKELGIPKDVTVLMTGTVQEEDCDGLCWQHLIETEGIRPEFVVITEPTACRIYRGHRGRMEIEVAVTGVSCHGSAPERGDNAIFKMAPILLELQELHKRLKNDPFLGKGSLTVSEIFSTSPSRCAVADGCRISIDRRLTAGETWEGALEEIRALPSVRRAGATVACYGYDRPSWTGLVHPTQCYFPTWVLPEDHRVLAAAKATYEGLFEVPPVVDKWTFSTNAVTIMGRHGIPCVGFGPGREEEAHAPDEKTYKDELVKATAFYAALPTVFAGSQKAAGKDR
jgi:putative selenium metabolism hydrolase